MIENEMKVNYELAYRLVVLLCATIEDQTDGAKLNMDVAHVILGVSEDDVDRAFTQICADGIARLDNSGRIWVG